MTTRENTNTVVYAESRRLADKYIIWLGAVLLTVSGGWAFSANKILIQPETSLLARTELTGAKAELVENATGKALKVVFKHNVNYPHVRFEAEKAGFNPDWSAYVCLGLTLENPGKETIKVNFRIDSPASLQQGRQGGAELLPGAKKRFVLSLGGKPIVGMRGQPPLVKLQPDDLIVNLSTVALDITKVSRFQIFMTKQEQDRTLLVHRVELFGDAQNGPGAFVDKFGQYSGADWPGKLHSEKDFSTRVQAEATDLAKHPTVANRDKWGGWADGPSLKATGHFYATKHNGKWWLVDPDGKLFWSSGITCVNLKLSTKTSGREQYFSWFPGEQDPLRKFYINPGKRNAQINFFAANLFRKYGPEYEARYLDSTVQRFRSWGITTVANWSDYDEISKRKGVAYTIPIPVKSKMFAATEHLKAGLVKKKYFPDVFDPQYAQSLEAGVRESALAHKDDPWLLGVFVDNELHWVSGDPSKNPTGAERISAIAFKNDGSFAIKQALVQALQDKFISVAALNQILGTAFKQWEELRAPVTFTKAQQISGASVFAELDSRIAEQYFKTVSQTIKKLLPGVPYLGCRFSNYSDEVVRQAAKYCDVVSFNIYNYLPEERLADELSSKYDFPVVIGEFHFGALDRGMFDPGLRKAENQADRAAKYAAYMKQAARGAWCVGAHWFQYVDQPLTGRDDGENYNIGFLSTTDDPYLEMVEAARKVNGDLYRIRMGK